MRYVKVSSTWLLPKVCSISALIRGQPEVCSDTLRKYSLRYVVLFYLVQPEVCSVMLRGTVRYIVLCYRVQKRYVLLCYGVQPEVCSTMLWGKA